MNDAEKAADRLSALSDARSGTRERIGKLLAAIAHENTPAAAAIRVMATELATLGELVYSIAGELEFHRGPPGAEDPADIAEMRKHVDAIGRALGEHGIIVANTDWRPGETVLVSTHTHERPPADPSPPDPEPQEQPPPAPPGDQQQDDGKLAPDGGDAPLG